MGKFLIGSRYFFSCYDDFTSKDIDELQIVNTDDFKYMRQITGKGKCLFFIQKQQCLNDYIEYALQAANGMAIGKFLVPEFCEAIGFSIKDLPRLKPLIDRLDAKHKYEEIIYDSYLENGCFTLTEEQRDLAYKSYKESRGA